MAKKRKSKNSLNLKAKRRKQKTKRVIGTFKSGHVKKRKHYKRKIKGKTELRRWGKGSSKAGQVKSVSMIIYNKHRSMDDFADDIQDGGWFIPQLNTIYYRAKNALGQTILPFSCVVIIEQRHRQKSREFFYEAYFMKPPATKSNIHNFTINTVRNHPEAIRRKLNRMGFTDVKYSFENFNPFHVPSIRIELIYE